MATGSSLSRIEEAMLWNGINPEVLVLHLTKMHFFLMQNLMGVGTSGKLSSREVRDPRAFYPEAPSCKHVFHFEL